MKGFLDMEKVRLLRKSGSINHDYYYHSKVIGFSYSCDNDGGAIHDCDKVTAGSKP